MAEQDERVSDEEAVSAWNEADKLAQTINNILAIHNIEASREVTMALILLAAEAVAVNGACSLDTFVAVARAAYLLRKDAHTTPEVQA